MDETCNGGIAVQYANAMLKKSQITPQSQLLWEIQCLAWGATTAYVFFPLPNHVVNTFTTSWWRNMRCWENDHMYQVSQVRLSVFLFLNIMTNGLTQWQSWESRKYNLQMFWGFAATFGRFFNLLWIIHGCLFVGWLRESEARVRGWSDCRYHINAKQQLFLTGNLAPGIL